MTSTATPAPRPAAPVRATLRVARDLGPLAWVMGELRRTLDETAAGVQRFVDENEVARSGDLAEVDATPLRLLRQQVHQAAGALEMVNLGAAARTLEALEAVLQRLVQKPGTATPQAAQGVARGARAVIDYLDRQMRERAVHDLALFPVYRDWQQLAGVAWVHPADLWSPPMPVAAELPAGPAWPAGPQVRAPLERAVLGLVKGPDPGPPGLWRGCAGGWPGARSMHPAARPASSGSRPRPVSRLWPRGCCR
jgi:chemosensory pili system protein ChpA (sensor histidine kinase/response regulator)